MAKRIFWHTQSIFITWELVVKEGKWAAFKHEVRLNFFLCLPELLAKADFGVNMTKETVLEGPTSK